MAFRYSTWQVLGGMIKARGSFNRMADRAARSDAESLSASELTAVLRDNLDHPWKPPGGGYEGALSHDIIHGLDITVALGLDRSVPADRLRFVLDGVSPRQVKYFGVDLQGIELQADDLDWSYGTGTPLTGAAQDLLLVLCTMPAELDTCLFTTSGTEANELAWRLATSWTGGDGAIIAEHAYHGSTGWMADLSSNEWPAGYRPARVGTFRAPIGPAAQLTESEAANRIGAATDQLARQGSRPALVLADSQFTSEGIHNAPPEFFAGLVAGSHRHGALLLADEVQSGFGRSGPQLWRFALAGRRRVDRTHPAWRPGYRHEHELRHQHHQRRHHRQGDPGAEQARKPAEDQGGHPQGVPVRGPLTSLDSRPPLDQHQRHRRPCRNAAVR